MILLIANILSWDIMHLLALFPLFCLSFCGASSPLNTTSYLRTGNDTTKLAFNGNSSAPSNATLREDLVAHYLTYNVWTINSTDGNGNQAIWDFLVSLGVDGSDISVLGLPPGLDDTDAFQLRLNVEQYKNFNNGVSISCLFSRIVN